MASNETDAPNIFAYRGRYLLSTYNGQNKDVPHNKLSELTELLNNQPIPYTPPDSTESPTSPKLLPVCIIGAGMAGLYTAMIFESLGISYHIVDADTRDRVGGRMFTYYFPNSGPSDYYEVGAMRFPDTPYMKRTFDLAKNRGLNVKLIPYIIQMVNPPNTWLFFNNARVNNRDPSVFGDPFDIKNYLADKSLTTPEAVHRKIAEVLQPFRDLFRPPAPGQPRRDMATSMEILFKETNKFSMRSYMMIMKNMDAKDIHWCETIDKDTGWYDRSLTQIVMRSLAFDWPATPLPGPEEPKDPNAGWYCFDGGSSTLPKAMFASLSEKAQGETLFKSPVTAISRDSQKEVMRISINGVESPREYSAVISTVPLPRLSLMDLAGVGIYENYAQWSAIRELQYGSAVKVGMKFSKPWWESLIQPIRGGQSYTDLPLRAIVYPSYPKDPRPGYESNVLIASYCWTQDAERLGAFIHPDGTAEPELIDLMFRGLAAVHGLEVKDIKKYYREGDYFAWDWLRDPFTMGGNAFFGPGVYDRGDIYSEMLRPAARGKLFFAGEAMSACNGWVAGALDSSWRAVDQYLALNHPESELQKKFWRLWGKTEYWDEASDEEMVKLNRKLMERHLVISLNKDGVMLEPVDDA